MLAVRARFLPLFKGVRTFANKGGNPDKKVALNLLKKLKSHDKGEKAASAVKPKIPIEKVLPAVKKTETVKQPLPKANKTMKEKPSKDVSSKEEPTKEVTAKEVTAKEATAKEVTAKEATAKEVTAKGMQPVEKVIPPMTDPDMLKLSNLLQAVERDASVPGKAPPSISGILSGIKVNFDRMRHSGTLKSHLTIYDKTTSPFEHLMGKGLGIFNKKTAKCPATADSESESLYNLLEKESVEASIKTLPRNFFEEAVDLTKDGKLWNFPISNEQGLEPDAPFHEHIFLERYLSMFPSKGPIRHFMELVMNGLSKNAFLSVKEKEEHILWFADYFKNKALEKEA